MNIKKLSTSKLDKAITTARVAQDQFSHALKNTDISGSSRERYVRLNAENEDQLIQLTNERHRRNLPTDRQAGAIVGRNISMIKPSKDKPHKEDVIKASDTRIKHALELLKGSERGRLTLVNFKFMCKSGANGLDMNGMSALVTLTKELAAGRRDFMEEIK